MAPTVEQDLRKVDSERFFGLTAQVMVIQLDSDDKLDIKLFDRQARIIADSPLSEINGLFLEIIFLFFLIGLGTIK